MSEFTTQGPAPSVSNLNGRFRWDQGSGLQQFSSTALAVTPADLTSDESDAENIQEVIDSIVDLGGGTIFLRNGTYLLDTSLSLTSNTVFLGETVGGVILDFQGGEHQIRVAGTVSTTDGTVSIAHLTTTVTGVGTSWTGDLTGLSINLQGIWYLIDSVTSDTELEIAVPFELDDLSGATYSIADTPASVGISTLTIQNSTHPDGAVYFTNCIDVGANDISVYDSTLGFNFVDVYLGSGIAFYASGCDVGVNVSNCNAWTFGDFEVYGSTGDNLVIDNLVSASISNFTNSSAGANGFAVTNSSNWGLYDFTLISPAGIGVELTGTTDIQIQGGNIQLAGSDAIKLTGTSDRIMISNMSLLNNTGYGINIADATDDDNIVSGVSYSNNTAGTINDSGTGTVIIDGSGGGGGTVDSVVAGNNIDVDATDPANPIVAVETLTPVDIGLAATVTELDYVDGVTSAIQMQLDGKQPLDSDLTTIAGLTATTDNFMVATASAWASRTPTQARTQLGLGSIATQASNNVTITGGSITGITDLTVADGGTGASTLTGIVQGNGTSAFTASTAPTISDFTNMAHDHGDADDGGALASGVITNAMLSVTAGEPGSAWQTWAPTLANLSGGTLNYAKWLQVGKTVFIRFKYTLAGAGVGSDPTFTAPVAMHADYAAQNNDMIQSTVNLRDTGTIATAGVLARGGDTSTIAIRALDTAARYVAVTATFPHTWANTDVIYAYGTYEAA